MTIEWYILMLKSHGTSLPMLHFNVWFLGIETLYSQSWGKNNASPVYIDVVFGFLLIWTNSEGGWCFENVELKSLSVTTEIWVCPGCFIFFQVSVWPKLIFITQCFPSKGKSSRNTELWRTWCNSSVWEAKLEDLELEAIMTWYAQSQKSNTRSPKHQQWKKESTT